MDNETFDRIVRLLGTPGSRRAALAALLGSAAGGTAAEIAAKGKGGGKQKRRNQRKKKSQQKSRRDDSVQTGTPEQAPGEVSGEAAPDCGNPGPSKNLKGCNYNGQNLAGIDLSGSNLRDATFNGANLCGAKLFSSTLTNVDFRNANLTKADLHSSACGGILVNGGTQRCQTIMCNGSVSNVSCPGVNPGLVCCLTSECAKRECHTEACQNSRCNYTKQTDGQPGTQCPDPRQCCDGVCCDDERKCCGDTCIFRPSCCTNGQEGCPGGQKCCGGGCIPEATCCTNDIPGFCPPETSECCGGECINPTLECCGNNDPGCPPGETCVIHETFGPDCCPDARACGPRCRTTPCSELCSTCNEQTGGCISFCEQDLESCCFGVCKRANGEACTQDSDCCEQVAEICGRTTPSGVKICCTKADRLCGSNAECCSGRCVDSLCEED